MDTSNSFKARNGSGTTISKGALVYINGHDNDPYAPTVDLADATVATKPAQFVALYDVAAGKVGEFIGSEYVKGYSTLTQHVGDVAYLSVTIPGSIQWAAPTAAGQIAQIVGVVASIANPGDILFFPISSFITEIGSNELMDGSVTNAKLAANAVTASVMASKTVTKTQVADNTITKDQIDLAAGILPTQLGPGVTKILTGTVAYNATSPYACIAIPANSIVTDVYAICTATFNGTVPKIDLGDDSDDDGFIAYGNVGLTSGNVSGEICSARGALLWVPGAQDNTINFDAKTGDNLVTTWGSPRRKYYATANHVNAKIGTTGSPTTGALTVICVYEAVA